MKSIARSRSIARSSLSFSEAQRCFPGGVNSPVRAFQAVGGTPLFIDRAYGARIVDVDGNTYIDYVMSWGPLILGHASPSVVEAVRDAATRGMSYGAPTEAETLLAQLVMGRLPSIQRLRFVSSGTEATMSALRLARSYTGRDLVLKFAGCYHGHSDAFLISAGSGALTQGVPSSPGIPAAIAELTIVVPYNDIEAVARAFEAHGERIAAVIVEPYAGNMGLVMPRPGFLHDLREITRDAKALLIFDEVMTGFRVDRGGVQTRENLAPDLTTLGKILGGGLPVGAFGGRAEIMDHLSPQGSVYQAGTLSGNPLAMASGIATLRALDAPGLYERLEAMSSQLLEGIRSLAMRYHIPLQTAQAGSMVGFFFHHVPVTDLASAQGADTKRFARFFHAMLERGIYLAPSQFETLFVSLAHNASTNDATLAAVDESFALLTQNA